MHSLFTSGSSSDRSDEEPLLTRPEYSVFDTIRIPELEELAEKQEASKWRENEIKLSNDLRAWKTLSDPERLFIEHVLAFSVVSDGLVNVNLLNRFLNEVGDPSARRFYLFQAFMEDVHARTYGLMLRTVIVDPERRKQLLNPQKHIDSIRMKIEWIEKWITSDASFGQRLVAFAIIEGIFFSALFCAFYWVKHRGIGLSGLVQANEFISRDEGMHCEFAISMLKYVILKPREDTIQQMVREAVAIEEKFVKDALPEGGPGLSGINSGLMIEYVKYVADRLLTCIPYSGSGHQPSGLRYCRKVFHTKLPIPWMEAISIQVVSNFFENEATTYVAAESTAQVPEDNDFSADPDDI
jgi:ribonucleoside-diphosphate reductase beta chain